MNKKMVWICAELGINHGGDQNLAMEMIRAAAENGANAVKFQHYDPDKIFPTSKERNKEAWKCHFGVKPLTRFLEYAHSLRIAFGISIFDNTGMNLIPVLKPDFIKLASRTVLKDWEFGKKVIDTVTEGLPTVGYRVVASLNTELLQQVSIPHLNSKLDEKYRGTTAIEFLRPELFSPDVSRLYCVSSYPSTVGQYDLLDWVFKEYDKDVGIEHSPRFCDGLSDHTLGIGLCLTAISRGATLIEKHFTLNKALPGSDQICSMTPSELASLRKWGDEIERVRRQIQG